MEENIFWDVFRDTGDPICWLLARIDDPAPAETKTETTGEDKPSPA